MPLSWCEKEKAYACEVVENLQIFWVSGGRPRAVYFELVCLPHPYGTPWFTGEGVHLETHWDG